ncbi:unnamed protein product [Rangifer tarandus platyrhynchus]|uniref:Uncharacterized protein n=2 Tax=Rangifer tarandus platyrhynchus TaxID=3082113 RepID=A0ABN9A0V8_RANTA|nr:unnamed protein product [Rangifer tarandus platyrhynchus]
MLCWFLPYDSVNEHEESHIPCPKNPPPPPHTARSPPSSGLGSLCYTAHFHFLLFNHSVLSDSLRPHGRSTPGFPVLHHLLELAQTHVRRVGDAVQIPTAIRWWCIYFNAPLSVCPTLSFPRCVRKCVLYVCVSIPALSVGSLVLFF